MQKYRLSNHASREQAHVNVAPQQKSCGHVHFQSRSWRHEKTRVAKFLDTQPQTWSLQSRQWQNTTVPNTSIRRQNERQCHSAFDIRLASQPSESCDCRSITVRTFYSHWNSKHNRQPYVRMSETSCTSRKTAQTAKLDAQKNFASDFALYIKATRINVTAMPQHALWGD